MPKSEIIKEVVEGTVPLEQSLRRLQVLAHDVNDKSLEEWAEKELIGYSDADEVPDYRVVRSANFQYSGINNFTFKVTNVPLPLDFLSIDTLNDISRLEMKHSIHSLTDLAKANSVLRIDRTLLASEVSDRTNDAVQCFSIEQLIPVSAFEGIEAAVRNKLIKALTSLEDNYGVLDKLGVSVQIAHSEQDANAGVVLNINNEQSRESASEKIAWKIIVPILTAVAGAILGAAAISYIGLG